MTRPDEPLSLAAAMTGRLRRRWAARTLLASGAAGALAAGILIMLSAGLLMFGWVNHLRALVYLFVPVALAGAAFGCWRWTRRFPMPGRKEALLAAEAASGSPGSVELAVDPGTAAHVRDTATAALRRAVAAPRDPLLTKGLRARLALSATVLVISFPAMLAAVIAAGPDSHAAKPPDPLPPLVRRDTALPDRPEPASSASALAELRNAILSGTAEDRRLAADRYANLWRSTARAAAVPGDSGSTPGTPGTPDPQAPTKAALGAVRDASTGQSGELARTAEAAAALLANAPAPGATAEQHRDWSDKARALLDRIASTATAVADAAATTDAAAGTGPTVIRTGSDLREVADPPARSSGAPVNTTLVSPSRSARQSGMSPADPGASASARYLAALESGRSEPRPANE